jgi:hypothetical protein
MFGTLFCYGTNRDIRKRKFGVVSDGRPCVVVHNDNNQTHELSSLRYPIIEIK